MPCYLGAVAMRKPKRAFWVAVSGVVALFLLVAAAWFLRSPPPPSAKLSPSAYERIAPGMRLAEVEAILGLPPGDHREGASEVGDGKMLVYGSDTWAPLRLADGQIGHFPGVEFFVWGDDYHIISVGVDEGQVVVAKRLYEVRRAPPAQPLPPAARQARLVS